MNGAKTLGRVGGVSGTANAGANVTAATHKDDKEEKVLIFFSPKKSLSLCLLESSVNI
jgi:hypothetical protein